MSFITAGAHYSFKMSFQGVLITASVSGSAARQGEPEDDDDQRGQFQHFSVLQSWSLSARVKEREENDVSERTRWYL